MRALCGTAIVLGEMVGRWHNQTGLPQGGALSCALFLVALIELHDELLAAECGITVREADGNSRFICMLAYADDIVLFASSPAQKWALRLRMRLKIDPNKSAIMVYGCSSISGFV